MKTIITTACFILFMAASFPPPSGYAAEQIVFGYGNQESFPNFLGKEEIVDPPGIYVEMLNRIATELGLQPKYIRMPSKRVMTSLQTGKIDVAVEYSYKPERSRFGLYPMKDGNIDQTRRLGALSYHLYKIRGSDIDWDGQTFSNVTKPIGANLGYSIVGDLEKMGLQVDAVSDTDSNLRKLQQGRICGYAQVPNEAEIVINMKGYTDIVKVPIPIKTRYYYIMFSKQYYTEHTDIAEKFWTRLGEIREETVQALTPKYLKLIPQQQP